MKTMFQILSVTILSGFVFSAANSFGQSAHPAGLEGFPFSGTSIAADHQLRQAGFLESLSRAELDAYYKASASPDASSDKAWDGSDERGSLDITPDYGSFKSPNLKGNTYTLPLYANYKLTQRIGLSLNLPVQYTQFRSPDGELDVWNVDATIGLPIKVIMKTKEMPFCWTITPHGGAGGYFADDTGSSHTFIGHGGLTSMLGYQNAHFAISMANQITFFETASRSGSYNFTDAVDQKVLKNGLKVSVPFCESWVADVYGIETEFLENTFLDRYVTVGASVGYHRASMKKGSYIKIGTYTELAKSFQSIHFQFGTGWKF